MEHPSLDLDRVDLGGISEALQDQSYERSWWLDPRTGEVEPWSADYEVDASPDERGLVRIHAVPSREWYLDMADFTERVADPRARDLLARAIEGRGAFRRFRDALFDFPALRDEWFAFRDRRAEQRAIRWLRYEGLIAEEVADAAIAAREDSPAPRPLDAHEVARGVADDLSALYQRRLRRVVLVGEWARGTASADSPIELLVVLDRVASPYGEHRAMDEALWRRSLLNGTVVLARPVAESALDPPQSASLAEALAEGEDVR